MADVAILGATGPTGIHLANILRRQNMAVRIVSRGAANLQRAFGDLVSRRLPRMCCRLYLRSVPM